MGGLVTDPKPQDPVELIRQAFHKKIPQQNKSGLIRLSGIGHECLRKIYLDNKLDVHIEEVLSEMIPATIGNTLHIFYEHLCKYFVDEYKNAEFEQRIDNTQLGCTGQIDIFIPDTETVIDFKTTGSANFRKIRKSQELNTQYTWQMQGYMMLKNAKHGYIVYVDRDTHMPIRDNMDYHPMFSIYMEPNRNIWEKIVKRISIVRTLWDHDIVPNIPLGFNPKAPPCLFCAHKQFCWS